MSSNLPVLERRRMLTERCPYIIDGLIFWLDGINKGRTNPNEWRDLVGGIVMSGQNTIPVDKGFRFDSSVNGMNGNRPIGMPFSGFPPVTVEICGTFTSVGYIFENYSESYTNSNIFLSTYGNELMCGRIRVGGAGIPCFECTVKSKRMSVCTQRAVVDGVEAASKGTDYWNSGNNTNPPSLMTSSARGAKGIINCIRIYNRQLSIDEMKQNQDIDNLRFLL